MYLDILNRMKSEITDGKEYNKDLEESEQVIIGHTECDYCEEKVIAVWDKNNIKNYWPFLGHQSRRYNSYKYSEIMNSIRRYYNSEGKIFDDEAGNNLLNVHARCHSDDPRNPKRWCDASVRILCNKCFQKTYNRIKVLGDDGHSYSLSVVKDRGETIESVMKDLSISGKVLGKGSIIDYD